MEPNLCVWLENQTQYEDWQVQLFEVMYDDFQAYFEEAKEEVAKFYGN